VEGGRGKLRTGSGLTDIQREHIVLGVLAAVVGAVAAVVARLFRLLIEWIWTHAFLGVGDQLDFLGAARYALIPVLGGLIVGPIVYYLARETQGSGVPEVMDAVLRFGGRIRARVIGLKAVTAALTIGTGGAAGREGPIVHMGSAIGSNIGQALKLTPAQTKILLGCGAAGGITATFNTPIAGVLFAVELIMMEFKTRSFIPIVISSAIATGVARAFEGGDVPVFGELAFAEPYLTELSAYLLLGLVCGLLALLFIKALYTSTALFEKLKVKPWLKPAIGGLFLGILGIAVFHVHGFGYEYVEDILAEEWTPSGEIVIAMGLLALVKILGVSLTLGSGGSGGVFAPSLFIGCMAGASYGAVVHNLFPDTTASYGAYALVGMAAFVAAATRGTLTAIMMIFEMTRTYEVIVPLLFACVIADMVASIGSPDSIYTKKLSRRGVPIVHDIEPNVMQLFKVGDVMVPREKVETLNPRDELHHLVAIIRRSGHNGFPVLDDNERLVGVVTHEDARKAQHEGRLFERVRDLMSTDLIAVTPDDTGESALRKLGDRKISHLPVVDPQDGQELVGWISKGDIVFAYEDYHRRMEAPLPSGPVATQVVVGEEGEFVSAPRPLFERLMDLKGRADRSVEEEPIEVAEPVEPIEVTVEEKDL
jgi:CIC family chloride channel protein